MKIQLIENNLDKLEKIGRFSRREFLDDFIKSEAAKHLLQVSIEAMIDISGHIIARKRLDTPGSSVGMFEILHDAEILGDQNLVNYKLMAKLKNRIVHIYNDLDDAQIFDIIQNRLDDFRAFITEIVKLF